MQDKGIYTYRATIADILGRIGDRQAVPTLISLLNDDWEVRIQAVRALGILRDERAIAPLLDVLQDIDGSLKKLADTSIGGESMETAANSIRESAATALGQLGEPAVEHLIAALKDSKAVVRRLAALALGITKSMKAIDPLISCLNDIKASVRGAAASALGVAGNARAVKPLIDSLKDKDLFVRRDAACALGEIKDNRALESLIASLNDKSWDVRYAAIGALKKITEQDFGEDTAKWHEWWEKNKPKIIDTLFI